MQAFHEQVITDIALPVRFTVYRAKGELIPMHWHNSMEIIYVLKGSMDVTVNEHISRLFAGDFILINSKELHATHSTPGEIFLLQLPYEFLKKHIPGYEFVRFRDSVGRFSFPGENDLKPIFDQMAHLATDTGTEGRLRLTSLIYLLLAELVSSYMFRLTENAKLKNEKNFKRLSLLMDYVKEHYTENISISHAAGLLHLEEAYFCRFFKKYTGQTFLEYVNSVRLQYVCEDMMHTDLPLGEILEKHGFHNYKIFSKMFHKIYGVSPRQKRRSWSVDTQR